jgi:hypothetical protein
MIAEYADLPLVIGGDFNLTVSVRQGNEKTQRLSGKPVRP